MALVVPARAPAADTSAGSVAPPAPGYAAALAPLRAAAVATTVVYVLALTVDAAARALPLTAQLDTIDVVTTSLAGVLTLAMASAAWFARRDDSGLLLAATLATVLAGLRPVAAALLVTLDLSILADVLNVAIGLFTLGSLVWAAAAWSIGVPEAHRRVSAESELFRRVAEVTGFVLFAVGLSGALVGAVGASWACRGVFPDCNGLGALPFGRDPLADIQLYHRLLAYVAFALVLWLTIEAFRTQRDVAGVVLASLVLLGAMLTETVIGALAVSSDVSPLSEVAHTVAAAVTWSAAVVLIVVARRGASLSLVPSLSPAGAKLRSATGGELRSPAGVSLRASRTRTLLAYVQLTKPRVMSLLLATTAAAMVIAARGLPDVGRLFATLLGGALMAGGAGAINHYVDRDIDPLMGRTAWRPIPSGVIAPRHALWFGIGLAVLASAVFAFFVNPLALVLSLVGLLGYVFIYTLWLKRSTPSNIVIGGAAGAIPPLVGWAAVANEIGSLTAWYLFAIIFFWTPPHFWALSLLIRKHYERAGVPMLPVVRGEDETRRQIVLYSVLLVVLTLVLSPFGMMGAMYFGAAALLGGLFIFDAVRLWRQATPAAARRLYLYSILYLFALFAAMAVDRVISQY